MALQTWCVKCGMTDGRPVIAVGYDEDGEAACVGHQVRAKKPLIIEEVQTSAPAPPTVDETEVSVHSFPPEFQNVSSPETPAQEEVMRARPAFAERKCACCGESFIPTGATQRFAFGHKPKRVQDRTPKTNRAYRIQLKEPLPLPTAIDLVPASAPEPGITIVLSVSKVQRLLELLLQ